MDEQTSRRDSFDWRLPLYGAASALILFVLMMFDSSHLLETLYFFAAAPIIGVALLVDAIRKKGQRRLAALSMGVAYMATSWGLFRILLNFGRPLDGCSGRKTTKLESRRSLI